MKDSDSDLRVPVQRAVKSERVLRCGQRTRIPCKQWRTGAGGACVRCFKTIPTYDATAGANRSRCHNYDKVLVNAHSRYYAASPSHGISSRCRKQHNGMTSLQESTLDKAWLGS